ncbi:hypothetical protein DSO57_1001697 [Entomophthora muscae]|uniref:Uncharacterized protein n=1 Tax=Entomophthora muscae TaxID=34485 RepID=A0ACC2SMA5_9FUNG|nr:hypothetical protein DSO57_1001697 [Entomophthora muscae]
MLEEKIEDIKEVVTDLQEDVKHLKSVLEELKLNHNQNYHDLAVKGAVTAYDEFVAKYSEIDIETDSRFTYEKIPDTPEFEASEGEAHKDQSPSFGGDTFQKLYHEFLKLRNRLFNYASGILPFGPKDVTHARSEVYDAENELRNLEDDLEKAENKLATDFGAEGEYVALNENCYDFVNSEYTYSICMFGEVHQKSNKDSYSTLLGNFEKWEGSDYKTQLYSGGAHCWHGPARLAKVAIECGAEEKVLGVSEPEKCEYHLRMTTPAACQPIEQKSTLESEEQEYDEL